MSNKKIIDYYVVESGSEYSLTKEVNKKILGGYQPFGSLSVCFSPLHQSKFYQSMVKYED